MSAPVLMLTAKPGTYAEYTLTMQTGFKVSDMHLEAQPGKTVKPTDLAAENKKVQTQRSQLEHLMNKSAQTRRSKAFVRVLPPQNGNTVLLNSLVLSTPDPQNPQKQRVVNARIIVSYDTSGKVVDVSASADDPQLDVFYKAMDLKTLVQTVQTSGSTSLYGLPLVAGQPATSSITVPMQSVMSAMTALLGEQSSAQASPLMMHVTTSYGGLNAAGQHTFTQTVGADAWKMVLNVRGSRMAMQVSSLQGGGPSAVRQDGLLQNSQLTQNMNMQLQFDLPGEPYRMVMGAQYTTTVNYALKTLTAP